MQDMHLISLLMLLVHKYKINSTNFCRLYMQPKSPTWHKCTTLIQVFPVEFIQMWIFQRKYLLKLLIISLFHGTGVLYQLVTHTLTWHHCREQPKLNPRNWLNPCYGMLAFHTTVGQGLPDSFGFTNPG